MAYSKTAYPPTATVEFSGPRSADPSTLAEPLGPGRARYVHLDIDLTVDFVGKRIIGHVDCHCTLNESPASGGYELVLDAAQNLEVHDVYVDGVILEKSSWSRDEKRRHDTLGLAIRISLPNGCAGDTKVVRVCYETAAPGSDGEGGCSALQWLSKEQTKGKKFPYMFSQCQAIHARAMLPCQDTCECKVTYNASIRAPSELNVLMSAVKSSAPVSATEPEWETPEGCGKAWSKHTFEQKVPIPAYLIAIVCGALEGRKIGPRSHVWSEKEMVDECAWEFADTEKFVAAGEALCGPYKWGIYDLLVLPPSFPYGGMENPCLTFVTPTLLAKDRSQVNVVAHEVSHSWSGNLVTNETWEHFWLNEGLCVFNELKILRDVYGEEEATLLLASRLKSMVESINMFGTDHNFTKLVPDLSGGLDPDDAFSTIPYVKGLSLFCLLESLVGGEKEFQPFLKTYYEKFGGSTVTSEQMRDYYLEFFSARAKEVPDIAAAMEGPIAALDWEKLFRGPGMPDYVPTCDAKPIEEAKALARSWEECSENGKLDVFSNKDIEGWSTSKLTVFLDDLLANNEDGGGKLSEAACARMAECYGFLNSNCELCFRFLRLALGAKWDGGKDAALDLATKQGRMKFTRPIYRALKSYDAALAKETFIKHRNSYHPICSKMVARDLEV